MTSLHSSPSLLLAGGIRLPRFETGVRIRDIAKCCIARCQSPCIIQYHAKGHKPPCRVHGNARGRPHRPCHVRHARYGASIRRPRPQRLAPQVGAPGCSVGMRMAGGIRLPCKPLGSNDLQTLTRVYAWARSIFPCMRIPVHRDVHT